MNKEIMKKLMRDMRLDACFESIKECTSVASDYIKGIYEVNDVDELVVALRSVEEDIDEIEEIIMEMALEYEVEMNELIEEKQMVELKYIEEIEELKHEQLQ